LVDAERYLLVCYCYVELNPVRAHMVSHSGDYLWSSYRAHAYGEARQVVRDHELYQQLGRTVTERCNAYRESFRGGLDETEVHTIRSAAAFSTPLGHDRFKAQIEAVLGHATGYARRGRPPLQRDTGIEAN
jgi:putative transposase